MFSLTLHYQEYTHPAAFARPCLTMYQFKVITTKVFNDTLSVDQGDRRGKAREHHSPWHAYPDIT